MAAHEYWEVERSALCTKSTPLSATATCVTIFSETGAGGVMQYLRKGVGGQARRRGAEDEWRTWRVEEGRGGGGEGGGGGLRAMVGGERRVRVESEEWVAGARSEYGIAVWAIAIDVVVNGTK